MAKKTKRKVSSGVRPVISQESADIAMQQTATPTVPGIVRANGRRSSATEEFKPDYSYIIKDLKRIGTLAGTFFAILIILSFIIK